MSGRQLRKGRLLFCILYSPCVLKICYFFRFVLYQMSKNMNRRIFYMFLVRLASVPEPAACNISSRDHVFKQKFLSQPDAKTVHHPGMISQQLRKCNPPAISLPGIMCSNKNSRANRMQLYHPGIIFISQQLITCWRSACNISSRDHVFKQKF